MLKQGLQKYGFQKGQTRNWDLQPPWLIMGFKFNQQVFLALLYILLFSDEFKLPFASIWQDASDNNKFGWSKCEILNMWITILLFQKVIPMDMENLVIAQH